MSAIFIFELKRFIRSKVLLLLVFDFAALTILAYALMFVERDLKPLYLYYIVILQFGFLFITLVISLNGIAKEVEDKNLLFYLQNNITLGRIYFV
ncbi:hypothetical protein [Eubacterium aggregans]|uniref:hypothetical protein n=1 Tax=Eubacterium aggregans TaxID=81409 RepID=UPI003F400EB3